jgi:DNA-binding NarL/FixJ family response regulator
MSGHAALRVGEAVYQEGASDEDWPRQARKSAESLLAEERERLARRHVEGVRSRADPELALKTWQALADGRWSVVERFDGDGRRHWIARENLPPTIAERRLTDLERRVVGYVAGGHSQKLIAYDLGLSEGTISKQVTSACDKLGLGRAELVELYLTLTDGDSTNR